LKIIKLKKSDILNNAKKEVQLILDKLESIKFVDAKLYLIDKDILNQLNEIDAILAPFKKDTKRCEIYSIDKIVNILNPKNTAYYYVLNSIYRSSQVWDRSKTIDRLLREKEISKNQLLKIVNDAEKNNEYDEFALENLRNEINLKIKNEELEYNFLIANKDNENIKILITNHKEVKLHGNIRWYYYNENGVKKYDSKHLSINYPNLLLFDEESEIKEIKRDIKIEKFLKNARRVFGNVYIQDNLI
jgi:glucan-binding YG repeat protein